MSGNGPEQHGGRREGNTPENPLDGASLRLTSQDSQGIERPSPANTVARALTSADLSAAEQLFRKSEGWEEYAEDFRADALRYIKEPPSAVFGLFEEGERLVAVGVLMRQHWDFAYWALSWVMVDPDMRRKGYGEQVVHAMLDHAKQHQETTTNPNCRVLLSAVGEQATRFYEKLGFSRLYDGPLPNGECLMLRDVTGPGLPLLDSSTFH